MSLWFAASAVSAQYRALWDLSATQTGWLTTIVQLGFVLGTAALATLNAVDIVPSRRLFASGAIFGSAANAALLLAPGFRSALVCRMLTGIALAAVYPPAMKMISTWFRARRGLAVGHKRELHRVRLPDDETDGAAFGHRNLLAERL